MTSEHHPKSPLGQMLVDGDYATIIFKRTFHHAPELVWEAITNPEELKVWFMAAAKNDAMVGGTFEMVAGPARIHSAGKILVWDPPHVFEHEWKVAPRQELPSGEDSIFRWELVGEGGSTHLTLTYLKLTKRTALGFTPGVHTFLDRLDAQLAHAPLPDWMTRFNDLRQYYPGWSKEEEEACQS